MATSRGVDRHFRGPGRQKSWRKGKTSDDATKKCSKGSTVTFNNEGLTFKDRKGRLVTTLSCVFKLFLMFSCLHVCKSAQLIITISPSDHSRSDLPPPHSALWNKWALLHL